MLKNHPKTELEYWQAIYALGGFIWRMNHDLADGRIEDPAGGINKDIEKARTCLAGLVAEMRGRFGVIAPQDCPQLTTEQKMAGEKVVPAPDGTEYYWDWYHRMKAVDDAVAEADTGR